MVNSRISFRSFFIKDSWLKFILIMLIIIHIIPIWIIKYFPTQDGPSHIYNSYVLKEYNKSENYKLREVYKLNFNLFPNWTSHIIMMLLMYVFPPFICEKILVSLCIMLLPLSLYYFLNAVDKSKTLLSLLGFMYAYNYMLLMGFYSFSLSMPIFFFTLGYWWKYKDKMNITHISIFYILLLMLYFCHFQSYLLLMLSLSSFIIFIFIYSACLEIWGPPIRQQDYWNIIWDKFKSLLLTIGYFLPAYFIMFSYYLSSTQGYTKDYWEFKALKEYFWGHKSLVYYQDDYIYVNRILLGLFAVMFLLTIYDRVRTIYNRSHESINNNPGNTLKSRLWTDIINGKEAFLIMSVIFTVLFFKSPMSLSSGGGWINDRIHLYIFLVLLPFFGIYFSRYVRYSIIAIVIVLSLLHLGYSVRDFSIVNEEIADLTSGVGMLENNTTLDIRSSDWSTSDKIGTLKYVSPFLHAPCYYCLGNGVAYIPNYEATLNYFPVNNKGQYQNPRDYILTWRVTNPDELKELGKQYDLIHSGKNSRLYHLKAQRK